MPPGCSWSYISAAESPLLRGPALGHRFSPGRPQAAAGLALGERNEVREPCGAALGVRRGPLARGSDWFPFGVAVQPTGPSLSHSGINSSMIAIDNKIEQAMVSQGTGQGWWRCMDGHGPWWTGKGCQECLEAARASAAGGPSLLTPCSSLIPFEDNISGCYCPGFTCLGRSQKLVTSSSSKLATAVGSRPLVHAQRRSDLLGLCQRLRSLLVATCTSCILLGRNAAAAAG